MKRAPVKSSKAVAPKPPKVAKPVRICERPKCENALKPRQKMFCSASCRNDKLASGDWVDKYEKRYAEKTLVEYLDLCETSHEPTLIPTQTSYIVIHNAKMPSVGDYADYLCVAEQTLYNWSVAHPEFARAMDRLLLRQKNYLINNGLSGRYSPHISKLMLGVNHGIVEKKEVDNKHRFLGVVKHIYERADELGDGQGA